MQKMGYVCKKVHIILTIHSILGVDLMISMFYVFYVFHGLMKWTIKNIRK